MTLYVGDSPTVPFGQDALTVLGVPGASDGTPINIPIDPPTHDGVPLSPPSPTPATVMPPSNPTGQVFSGSNTDFLVNGTSLTGTALANAPTRFITVSEDGTIAAWGELGSAPSQRMDSFVVVIDNSDTGAIYKGVTVSAESGSGNLLYAANFSQSRIDVFDAAWQPVTTISFTPDAPGGRNLAEFSPFNIERMFDAGLGREVLIVAYAKIANASGGEEESTDGFIAKFEIDGTFLLSGDAGGLFNAPWGIAVAPSNFGAYSNALLVGNFGDGKILALDIATFEPEGFLLDATGAPATVDGLWDITFGNGASLGRTDALYFAAGPEEESHGLFGSLSVTGDTDPNAMFIGTNRNDIQSAASGDDTLYGLNGNDTIMGQLGADRIGGGRGQDTIFGGLGNDTLSGGDEDDKIFGGRGDDAMNGGAGDDMLSGGDGNDRLGGHLGGDTIDAGAGNDKLYGNEGADTLRGGDGDDSLFGGADIDFLIGGGGNDRLSGGEDADTYVFAQNFGDDRVRDFDAALNGDLIDLTAFGLTNETFADAVTISGQGDHTRITVDGGGTILLFHTDHLGIGMDQFLL